MRTAVRTVLKGARYYDAGRANRDGILRLGKKIRLIHNSKNIYDKYAVEAYLASDGSMLGHISRDLSQKYSELLTSEKIANANITAISGSGNELRIEIEIQYDGDDHGRGRGRLHNSKIWKSSSVAPTSPGVYKLQNDTTQEIYIGSSNNVRSRLMDHIKALESGSHSNRFLQDSYETSGPNSFSATVIAECESEHLLLFEEREIGKALSAGSRLFNMTETGQGVKPAQGAGPTRTISTRISRIESGRRSTPNKPTITGASPPTQNGNSSTWPALIGWLILLWVLYAIFSGAK